MEKESYPFPNSYHTQVQVCHGLGYQRTFKANRMLFL